MDFEKIKHLGLTSHQAKKLLEKYGLNEIKEEKKFTLLKSFLSQFNNFLILLLLAAAGISFFIGESLDAIFILAIVILNAFFGVYQEYQAVLIGLLYYFC
jgi:Ca2+-transporting ATPase